MNKDVNKRDVMIFGEYYKKEAYCGGVRWFDDIDYDTLKWLVEEGFADKDDAQNCSPTIGEFLSETEKYKDHVTFDGYTVSPERCDYRVSIDAINVEIPFEDHELLAHFTLLYHSADEFGLSPNPLEKTYTLRAWWD